MQALIRILHIGEQSDFHLVGQLLGQVHQSDYLLKSGGEFLNLLLELLSPHYDLILLDYHFQRGISARELLTSARSQGCDKPIIVMTDEMEAEVDREAIQLGASDYLIKGRIDSQLIERTLRYALERKQAERKLAKLAHYDQLTNVPNRILFRDRLEHALQLAKRGHRPFTLMYLDLNGFKQVNDKFGHEFGDALLQSCAARLRDCMRKSDSLARMGGDEFTVLLEHTDSLADISAIAEKIIYTLSQAHWIKDQEVLVGCSIGVAVYPNAGRDADSLLRNADLAMYQAKLKDNSGFCFFTEAMNVATRRQVLLASDLQRGVEREEFRLQYEPRINLNSGACVALVSRLLWYHPTQGWLPQERFDDLAESSGLTLALGAWQLQQIAKDWQQHSRQRQLSNNERVPDNELPIVLRLSARQLADRRLPEQVRELLRFHQRDGLRLEFEIIEADLLRYPELLRRFCHALRDCSVSVGLRDFGLEYSSARLMQSASITTVCFAPALLPRSLEDREAWRLLAALQQLCKTLGKQVVVEGLHQANYVDRLRELDFDAAQGQALAPARSFSGFYDASAALA